MKSQLRRTAAVSEATTPNSLKGVAKVQKGGTRFSCAVIGLIVVLNGCGRLAGFTSSGVPKAVNDVALLETAGKPQGLTSGGGGNSASNNGYATNMESNYDVAISSGTPGQLLAEFRKAVRAKIESLGASIHGESVSGEEDDIRSFGYDYDCSGNSGIVRVDAHVNSNGRIQVEILCYEHAR